MGKIALLAVLGALGITAPAAQAWPTWGNLENKDCAFAAAANWEMIHGGTIATEASILAEYNEVTHGQDSGISGEELESIWRTHGIGGRKKIVRDTTPNRLRPVMRRHGAIIAELAITPGERYGKTVYETGGIHFAVVRYITRRGPIILSWGELEQMTWWQWREDALLLYVPH